MPTVREIVRDELKKQQPTFLEQLGQQMIFRSYVDSAVSSQLPHALQKNNGLISQYVKTHMLTMLNQQHYFIDAMRKQRDLFQDALNTQTATYKNAENSMSQRLNNKVNVLVRQTISHVSNQDKIIAELRKNIRNDVTDTVNRDINHRINSACFITGIVSMGVSFLISRSMS